MSDWYIDKESGIGSFKSLEDKYGIGNYVTYDNSKWGNMSPSLAVDKEEVSKIDQLDRKLTSIANLDRLVALITPPEDTMIHFDKHSFELIKTLDKEDTDLQVTPVRANSMILEPDIEETFGVVFGPADCAIVILVHPDWPRGMVLIHLGLPQLFQGLHYKTMRYFKSLMPDLDLSKAELFITPHISKERYSIDESKYSRGEHLPNMQALAPYIEKKFHKLYKEERYFVDIGGYIREYFEKNHNITKIKDSGICTYEASLEGNLFSRRHYREELFKGNKDFRRGIFNVVVRYESIKD